MEQELADILAEARAAAGATVFLTGAGISAASGIPTFRGEEGYWRVGSRNYHPQELATCSAFQSMPEEIWAWYLYRRTICHDAEPNVAHEALVRCEEALGDRFVLITQNVDGLHLRAGSSDARTYQIHGNVHFARCAEECDGQRYPMPDALLGWQKDQALTEAAAHMLRCPSCRAWLRPYVLWFDEYYDEARYRFESSMQAAQACGALIIVGTSGATNLPMQVAKTVAHRGVPLIVVDPEPSPFTEMAAASPRGWFARGTADAWVPQICRVLSEPNP